jgi:hypothetical protein
LNFIRPRAARLWSQPRSHWAEQTA